MFDSVGVDLMLQEDGEAMVVASGSVRESESRRAEVTLLALTWWLESGLPQQEGWAAASRSTF